MNTKLCPICQAPIPAQAPGGFCAAAFFQSTITEQAWTAVLAGVRKPLGDLLSRKVKSTQATKSLPGAPDGDYLVMQFDASFAGKEAAVETVTFTQEQDGGWRASGY